MTEPGTGRQHSEREERAKRAPQPRTNGQHSQREERAKRAPQPRTNGQLVVLLGGHRAGVVSMGTAGRLEFRYDDAWSRRPDATAMSLSLPLGVPVHGDPPVRAYLWGLLPDNEQVLDRWARAYQVSAGNPFALLSHVGEDCAGAVQFVTPDRVHAVLAGHGGVRWLTVDDVAQRLRVLRRDPTAWHLHETGQFSLAGAQAKTALHHDPGTGRWGEPHGAVPTTHIVKPAITGLDDHDLNEHLCLTAVRALGLPAAISRVVRFGAERAVVVERYDRTRHDDGTVSRVHQEDMCQALGVPPTARYQNEGGPGPEQIIALIRTAVPACLATATVDAFTGALAVNWLLAGTDAHAKNYSLLLAGPQVRLAPLYDIASALPYDGRYLPKLRMAMKIGGEYRVTATTGRHWRRFAQANGLDPQAVVDQVDGLAAHLPDALATAGRDPAVRALRSPLPARLLDAVADRAAGCRAGLRHRDG